MRLVTRSDFDGLACAVLLKEAGIINDYKFVHPKDVQEGLIEVTSNDVLANIPYVPGCGLWFDHHASELERLGEIKFEGSSQPLPSCARVIWNYYGGLNKFSQRLVPMMEAVDKLDSANLTVEEIENPTGWTLLGYIMDPRTGLGRYRDYDISNYQLMLDMIDYCRTKDVKDILKIKDVQQRVARYTEQNKIFKDMLLQRSKVYGNVVVLDLREQEEIYSGNRFLIYTLFPDCNVSIQVMWGLKKQNIVLTVGYSITNRTCKTNIGSLMLKYGGGGHTQVGTCQLAINEADSILEKIIEELRQDNA